MNCVEFEDIVADLNRAKMMNARSRAAGMAHAETCERCASRLADERALGAALKSLAASDEGKAAPASVEAALVEAFRERADLTPARRAPVRSNWPRWRWIAAAVVLVAFGFIVYRAIQNDAQKDDKAQTEKAQAPRPVKLEEQVAKESVESGSPNESRAQRRRRGYRPRRAKPFIIDSITAYAGDSEYATDFFPLAYGSDQKPMESGEVIRVQMPRSALIAFGLPVSVEQADKPVKADVLIGEDGLARAIRFVR
jgi:hypothetical protein